MDISNRIEIVLLMAKLESVTLVRRELQARKRSDIPHENTLRRIYEKFKLTGSVHDIPKSGRHSMDDDEKGEILNLLYSIDYKNRFVISEKNGRNVEH